MTRPTRDTTAPDPPLLTYGTVLLPTDGSEATTDAAADLVVTSTRARGGAGRLVSGSVTEAVIESGDVPVLAVQR